MNIDPQLLQKCIERDRRAQEQLYKRCYPLLMSVCMRYCGNEAEAAAALNLGFLKILNNLKKYRQQVPFVAWTRRIMINTLIDEYRKNKKYKAMHMSTDFESPHEYANAIDYNQADKALDASDIEAMIRQLPEMSRQVFNLFALDGFSHKEIGKQLGISEGTSKWHVSFARKELRKMLASALKLVNI